MWTSPIFATIRPVQSPTSRSTMAECGQCIKVGLEPFPESQDDVAVSHSRNEDYTAAEAGRGVIGRVQWTSSRRASICCTMASISPAVNGLVIVRLPIRAKKSATFGSGSPPVMKTILVASSGRSTRTCS